MRISNVIAFSVMPLLIPAFWVGRTSAQMNAKASDTDSAAIKRIQAPVLGVYGANDERIDATLPDVAAKMQSAGKTFNYDVYPGTGHGFLKPGRQGSDGPQVERAWKRILDFYRARLGK